MAECYQCGSEDHFSRDCPDPGRPRAGVARPAAKADTFADHMSRIRGYMQLWDDGKITLHQKRRAIADENLQWYGGPVMRNGVSLTTP